MGILKQDNTPAKRLKQIRAIHAKLLLKKSELNDIEFQEMILNKINKQFNIEKNLLTDLFKEQSIKINCWDEVNKGFFLIFNMKYDNECIDIEKEYANKEKETYTITFKTEKE